VIELLRRHSIAYQQYTATAGVQALEFVNRPPSAPVNTNTNDRKRRKMATITTTPIPTDQPRPGRDYAALAHQLDSQPPVHGTGDWDFLARWQPSAPVNTNTNGRKRRRIAPITTTLLPTD
jgi:hypothetical protein